MADEEDPERLASTLALGVIVFALSAKFGLWLVQDVLGFEPGTTWSTNTAPLILVFSIVGLINAVAIPLVRRLRLLQR